MVRDDIARNFEDPEAGEAFERIDVSVLRMQFCSTAVAPVGVRAQVEAEVQEDESTDSEAE
eukprot:2203802-Lingulodinium_polyedra.AAC.1